MTDYIVLSAQKAAASSPLNFGRIAKPLRGGGGGAATTTLASPTPISGGGASANPLSRLQNEEGCVVLTFFEYAFIDSYFDRGAKRASWFFNSR